MNGKVCADPLTTTGLLLQVERNSREQGAYGSSAAISSTSTSTVLSAMLSESPDTKKPSPDLRAGFWSRLLISWASPFVWKAYGRRLAMTDLYTLGPRYSAQVLSQRVREAWDHQELTNPSSSAPLAYYRTLSRVFGGPFYRSGITRILVDLLSIISPHLMRLLIRDMADRQRGLPVAPAYGYAICAAMFLVLTVRTLSVNSYLTTVSRIGMQVRTATAAVIYDKMLRVAPLERKSFSSGTLVSLMSTDAARMELAVTYFHFMWSAIFQIFVSTVLLYGLLGWCSLVGLAGLVLFLPIQGRLIRWQSTFRKDTCNLTDRRVKIVQEILAGIRAIKFYAWETAFLGKVDQVRQEEMNRISRLQYTRALISAAVFSVPVVACMASFLACAIAGHPLEADTVFPALAYYNLLRVPLMSCPKVFSLIIDARISFGRVAAFLRARDANFTAEYRPDAPDAINIENVSFSWSTESFHVDSLCIPRGSLVAVVGAVGSGKSSLLAGLVGEMEIVEKGKLVFGCAAGLVGYCGQQAWIQSTTIRDNITFGTDYDPQRYQETLRACALEEDLADLPDGDATELGERGISLSGGQRQRISLARAVYGNAEIILMDDPLSAVDPQVGRHLFDQCICGVLKDRTRLLVTSQLHLLPYVDYIVQMEGGRIVQQGTFEELMYASPKFSSQMHKHAGPQVSEWEASQQTIGLPLLRMPSLNNGGASANLAPAFVSAKDLGAIEVAVGVVGTPDPKAGFTRAKQRRPTKRPLNDEGVNRRFGAVATSSYLDYIGWCGGGFFLSLGLASIGLTCLFRIATDVWLSLWVSSPPRFDLSNLQWVSVYLVIGGIQCFVTLANGLFFARGGLGASRRMHSTALKAILASPMRYFEETPVGKILNRFSKDQDVVDTQLSDTLSTSVNTFATMLTTLLLIGVLSWAFVVPMILLLGLFGLLQQRYRHCSGELDRLEALSRAPLYSHFSESLTGCSVIRASGQKDRFIADNLAAIDENNQPAFLQQSIQRWLRVRLEMVANVLTVCAAVASYALAVDPAFAGLAIGYALGLTTQMIWLVRQLIDIDSQVIASERITNLAGLPPETGAIQGQPSWAPSNGKIEFVNLTLAYRPDLFPVLRNLSFLVEPGWKIGIVGRTGAGKSSILVALFRFIDPLIGSIFIDDTDISTIDLYSLRRGITIIPQEPAIFSGTVRSNLDPTGMASDQECWAALTAAHLRETVMGMSGKLDASVSESGANLSLGHRQLICLARALLRRTTILVLDEATATIDLETDQLVQSTLRSLTASRTVTVMTIAHRIETVLDYDRILVMEAGEMVEYDAPSALLRSPTSALSVLMREKSQSQQAASSTATL